MKVALLVAYYNINSRNRIKTPASSPPLGLGYIASYLQRNGHHVQIFDDSVTNINQIKYNITYFKPDIVGFTTFTFAINHCFLLAKWVKEFDSSINVVFGGPHASYLPYETLVNECVDSVVYGEGEETMVELVNRLAKRETLEGVKGVLYKDKNNRIINNGPRPLIEDLDSIPFPAHELFPIGNYYGSVYRKFSNKNMCSIITSRGCPYRCTFCSHKMFGSKIRFRSVENVIDEIDLLVQRYGIGEFIVLDDTFILKPNRVLDICESILKRGLNISWSCNLRVKNASEKLYSIMGKAGCKGALIGVESGSQEVLDLMKKETTIDQIVNAVALAKKYFEYVTCSFILGMPGDTLQRAYQTIEFAKKLDPDYANFYIATPLPGSQLFDEAVKRKLIDKKNLEVRDGFVMTFGMEPVIEMSEINKKDLVVLIKKAHRDFYFRLGYIWNRLFKIRSTITFYYYILGIWRIICYQFVTYKNLFFKDNHEI